MSTATLPGRSERTLPVRLNGLRGRSLVILALTLGVSACDGTAPARSDSAPTASIITSPAYDAAATSSDTSPQPEAIGLSPTVVDPIAGDITVARPSATLDRLVGDEGAKVHVRCVGQGATTVVLIAGFGGDLAGWVDVEPVVARDARVCSYDHPGTGTSDPAIGTTSFRTRATELHVLLDALGEPAPYLVVGHSFGGAEAVTFASMFPTDVVGLVLVDASPATWPTALCAVPDDGTDGAAMLRDMCSVTFLPTGNGEHLDVDAAFAEVARITSLGSLPLAILTATERTLPADLAAAQRIRLNEEWNQGQQDWRALSTVAHLVTVEHVGHHIEIDRPTVVINEITRLLP